MFEIARRAAQSTFDVTFLLDTNVISELARPLPNAGVVGKFRAHQRQLVTAAAVWHELVFGVERMPQGGRREQMEAFLESLRFSGLEFLPYDQPAAEWHARQRARLMSIGKAPPFVDGQIAAVAAVHGLALVTNNTKHFADFEGLDVVRWHRD